jgi:hypothetical protein
MTKTVAALYDNFQSAQQATRDLVNHGFDRNDVSLAANDASGEYSRYLEDSDVDVMTDEGAAGAGTGALIGGLGGLVVGLGALLIPGVGPIIAAGPLVNALVGAGIGAGVGAVTGGLIGALIDLGIPENEAEYYAEGIRRGGTLVTVRTTEDLVDSVKDILDRYHPVDMEERSSEWRESGWSGFDPDADYDVDDDDYHVVDASTYDYYNPAFRRHYQSNYANSGYNYDQYAIAYRYGYDLANRPEYSSREWNELEPVVQRSWEEKNEGTWEQFKDAVRYAWEEVKDAVGVR